MTRKRPFGVTVLLWLVLSLSAWGTLRLFGALRWWDVLYEFEARLGPLYLSITGAGWALAGGILLWSMFSAKSWALAAIPISVFIWLMEYWMERLVFESPRAGLPFALISSLFLLIVTLVSALTRNSRNFFTKSEEHEQPNQHTESA